MKNKLAVLLRMLAAEKIDIIGIQEIHFPGVNTAIFNDYKISCSGTTLNSWSGIALLINKRMQKHTIKFVPVSERCGLLYLNTNFRPTIIINFDVPPNRNERSSFVDSRINTIHSLLGRYNIIILGDFKMKIGKEAEYVNSNVIGHATILQRNCEHSKKLLDFCRNNNFKIENTFFSHRESNTYTFVRARQKSQIDFFISNVHRWFDDVKALTNINISDHRMFRANITVKNLWSYHSGSRQTSIGPNTYLSRTNITRKPNKVQILEDARLFDLMLIRKVANFVNITRQEKVEAC
ncbi:craniofacial development protein 2-like [Gordionus sp. m RMFG-2023]|uniref:craniofacial development protein 2-like n=1 Tax=Gordionus sp. m RMFG-2023 TaxID=3053472 RepID=UPI0031FBDD42